MARHSLPSPLWLASAMVLCTATQLRLSALPLGPGEVLLGGWLLISLTAVFLNAERPLPPIFKGAALFWTVSFLLLGAGAFVAVENGRWAAEAALHDLVSYGLAAVFSLVFLASATSSDEAHRLLFFLTILSLLSVSVLALFTIWTPTLGPIGLWYDGVRLRGWAENPNQLSLLLVTLPFLCLHFIPQSRSPFTKTFLAALFLVSIPLGLLTQSDALGLAWLTSGLLLVPLLTTFQLLEPRWTPGAILIRLVLPLVIMLLVLVYFQDLLAWARTQFLEVYQSGSQGEARMTLWRNGLRALKASPWVGNGPGPHSGLYRVFGGSESHNALLDWGASTGVIGLFVLLSLFVSLGVALLRARRTYLFLALIALAAYGTFHQILRHPLVWCLLFSLYLTTVTPARPAAKES